MTTSLFFKASKTRSFNVIVFACADERNNNRVIIIVENLFMTHPICEFGLIPFFAGCSKDLDFWPCFAEHKKDGVDRGSCKLKGSCK